MNRCLSMIAELPPEAPVTMPAAVAKLLLVAHHYGLTKRQRDQLDRMLERLEAEQSEVTP